MSDRQRLHREEPERSGPIRNWSTFYSEASSPDSHDSSPGHDTTDKTQSDRSWNDVVSHGVKLGYRVVEEHIRQGQRVAEQINNRSYSSEAMGNDARELIERIVHYYTDLGSLWGDLANSLLANPDVLGNLLRRGQAQPGQQAGSPPNGTPVATAFGLSLDVISTYPTQVTLDLHPHAEKLPLVTYGLHAGDPQKPPLSEITFNPNTEDGRLLLRIRIPERQPPDVYTGVVVDKNTNLPKGTLSVRIEAQPLESGQAKL